MLCNIVMPKRWTWLTITANIFDEFTSSSYVFLRDHDNIQYSSLFENEKLLTQGCGSTC